MVAIKLNLLLATIHASLVLGRILGNDEYPIENGRNVIIGGDRQPGDDNLYVDQVMEKGQPFSYVGNEYCYPQKGSADQVRITSYEVKDLDRGDDGGLAFDVSGGAGQSQVCVFLKSKYGKSYNFKIDVYGFRLNNGGLGTGNFGGMGTGSGSGYGNYGGFGTDSYGRPNTQGSGVGGYGSGVYSGGNSYDGRNGVPFGNNNPAYGNTNPSFGTNNPAYGNTNPPFGTNNPAYGNTNPSFGTNNPAYGNTNPSFGTNNPAYGNTNPPFGTYQ